MITEAREPLVPQTQAGSDMASLVREAWLATATLDGVADAHTRQSAFVLVLEAMLRRSSNGPTQAATPTNGVSGSPTDGGDDLYSTADLRGDAISSYLEVPRDQVERLFAIEEPEPTLQLPVQKLALGKRPATREIGLLVVAARTALGLDTFTDHIRESAEYYRKYDGPNFLSTLQKSDEFVVLGRPRTRARVVRLRRAGVAGARELAQKLVAE